MNEVSKIFYDAAETIRKKLSCEFYEQEIPIPSDAKKVKIIYHKAESAYGELRTDIAQIYHIYKIKTAQEVGLTTTSPFLGWVSTKPSRFPSPEQPDPVYNPGINIVPQTTADIHLYPIVENKVQVHVRYHKYRNGNANIKLIPSTGTNTNRQSGSDDATIYIQFSMDYGKSYTIRDICEFGKSLDASQEYGLSYVNKDTSDLYSGGLFLGYTNVLSSTTVKSALSPGKQRKMTSDLDLYPIFGSFDLEVGAKKFQAWQNGSVEKDQSSPFNAWKSKKYNPDDIDPFIHDGGAALTGSNGVHYKMRNAYYDDTVHTTEDECNLSVVFPSHDVKNFFKYVKSIRFVFGGWINQYNQSHRPDQDENAYTQVYLHTLKIMNSDGKRKISLLSTAAGESTLKTYDLSGTTDLKYKGQFSKQRLGSFFNYMTISADNFFLGVDSESERKKIRSAYKKYYTGESALSTQRFKYSKHIEDTKYRTIIDYTFLPDQYVDKDGKISNLGRELLNCFSTSKGLMAYKYSVWLVTNKIAIPKNDNYSRNMVEIGFGINERSHKAYHSGDPNLPAGSGGNIYFYKAICEPIKTVKIAEFAKSDNTD